MLAFYQSFMKTWLSGSNRVDATFVTMKIPFHQSVILPADIEAVTQSLLTCELAGDGRVCKQVEASLSKLHCDRPVLLTPSCTAALELALMALEIGPGDEVILPSYTFSSTATCVVRQGAKPVFADIQATSLNLDFADVKRKLNSRTRGVIVVHYGGVGCDVRQLRYLLAGRNIAIIEDNAHGLGASLDDQPLGVHGDFSALSFHNTKNITCGEGGALVINNPALLSKIEIIRQKGTNRSAMVRGEVDKYSWHSGGSSYLLAEPLAALLLPQLNRLELITSQRRSLWNKYAELLAPLRQRGIIQFQEVPQNARHNGHLFAILLNDARQRQALSDSLKLSGVAAHTHYVPLHSSPFGKTLGEVPNLKVTDDVAERLLRLPLHSAITIDQVGYISELVSRALEFDDVAIETAIGM